MPLSSLSSGNLKSDGGIHIPTPLVRLRPRGVASGDHDRAYIGGLGHAEFEAMKDLKPQVWLFRYKRGYSATVPFNSAYLYDNARGYVHPSNWVLGGNAQRHIGGGAHTNRQGTQIPDRQTEWDITAPHKYEAEFTPELWFLNTSAKLYTWPIVPIATASGYEFGTIGHSGQSGNNTGFAQDPTYRASCGSTRTKGTQVQYFAFAFAVQDAKDKRNYLVGPLSEVVKAEIWPRVKIGYGMCRDFADRGRKIRLRHD